MHHSPTSLLNGFPPLASGLNREGRARCAGGILDFSTTQAITAADYPSLDFLVIEDFLPPAATSLLCECFHALRATLNDTPQNSDYWQGRILYSEQVARHFPEAAQLMRQFQGEATRRLTAFYQLLQPLYADTVHMTLWKENMFMPPHADNANPDGSVHVTPWRQFSSIAYLNDDYDGGELYFTATNRYIKPRRGMLIAFTGGFHHEHGVLKITRGERLTMPAFYTYDRSRADRCIHQDLQALS